MALYALTIFLSSFLLFQVQPVIAKIILPWFGGSAAVWNACMLFFQAALLGGYTYAHLLFEKFSPRRQSHLHAALLAASLLTLPILPSERWKPTGAEDPTALILALLALTIGLPYFLLSTTGPLLQAWYARTYSGAMPWRLFALSNFASLLALLTYPLFIEPTLDTDIQAWTWSGAYVLFAILCASLAWKVRTQPPPPTPAEDAGADFETPIAPPTPGRRGLWIALLLSVTTYLTQDVAAIPFLWIVPLVLYLLTFILAFELPRLYTRWLWFPLLAAALGGVAWLHHDDAPELSMLKTIAAYSAAMFVCAMVCHGELASLKPHPRYLTGFYVSLSVGGALGGLFVGLIAPNFFNAYYEFPLGWWLAFALAIAALCATHGHWLLNGKGWAVTLLLLLFLGAYGGFWANVMKRYLSGYKVTARNFYGTLRVEDEGNIEDQTLMRQLLHGVINHGQQYLHPARRREPTTYYCRESGVGRAMLSRNDFLPHTAGVIGLGTGTLASYGRVGDQYHIFEINPLVVNLARAQFGYVNESRAAVKIHLGDARLTLDRLPPLALDVLAVDAFSGDSVPVHLLTQEAFALYWRHLRRDGILAVHISNKYLGLEPVVAASAAAVGKQALVFDDERDDSDEVCFGSTWVLVYDAQYKDNLQRALAGGVVPEIPPNFRTWTDRFSNLARVIKK
jgi:SAM-dependent methyltransferase